MRRKREELRRRAAEFWPRALAVLLGLPDPEGAEEEDAAGFEALD